MQEWFTQFIQSGQAFLASFGLSIGMILTWFFTWLKNKVNEDKIIQKLAKKATDKVMAEVVPVLEEKMTIWADNESKKVEARLDAAGVERQESIAESSEKINQLLQQLPETAEKTVDEELDKILAWGIYV